MNPERTALVLIGFQNDYFAPDGALRDATGERPAAVLANTLALLDSLAGTDVLIASTSTLLSADSPEVVASLGILAPFNETGPPAGQHGSLLVEQIRRHGDRIVQLPDTEALDAFSGPGLDELLRSRGIEDVVFAGAITSLGVDATARSARVRGYRVSVLSDCTLAASAAEQRVLFDHVFPVYARVLDRESMAELIGDDGVPSPGLAQAPTTAEQLAVQTQRRVLEALGERESQLTASQRAGQVGWFHWDLADGHITWSPEMYRIFGLDASRVDLTYAAILQRAHPEDRERVSLAIETTVATHQPLIIEHRIVRPDGEPRWIQLQSEVRVDRSGTSARLVGTARDVTEVATLRRGARAQQALLEGVLDAVTEPTVACDNDGRLTLFNRAARELLGRDLQPSPPALRPQLYGLRRPDGTLLSPDELPLVRTLREGGVDDVEIAIEGPNGERRTLVGHGRTLREPDGNALGAVVAFRDVTEERSTAAALRERSLLDPLTGLATRALLEDHLRQALDRGLRKSWATALIAIDIDRFQHVNDSFGHDAGDRVLLEVGRRLQATLRSHDTVARPHTVARLGGDEFFVLCEDVTDARGAAAIASRLADAISAPMPMGDETVTVTAGMGVVVHREAQDPEALVLAAEFAMRQAKGRGPGRRDYFTEEMGIAVRELSDTEAALGRALADGQLRLAYQPKVSLATGQIAGVEALLRWEHPERGTVPPSEFITLAERTGLIVPIGAWALEEACRQAARWAASFPTRPPLHVSVNVSGRQFDTDVVATVARALDGAKLGPWLLCLEVTESTVMTDVDTAVARLENLKALGVIVSVDDFGTGYSSLSYLRRLPIDEIKVDKSFVDGLGRDPHDTAIVAAVVGMAHALDLIVVAEGVETEDQRNVLRTLGCEYAQGYYYARPQPPDAVDALLVAEAQDSWVGHQTDRRASPDDASGTYRVERVVVADDTPDVLQLARLSLTTAGFEVHEVANGREAITLVDELRPDCVVLDVVMPDMDGFAVCRALRSRAGSSDCTIIMLTATSSPESKAVAFLAGADDYIVKPFAPRDLVSRIRAAMNRRLAERS